MSQSPLISRLVKEWLESGQNGLPNEIKNLLQARTNVESGLVSGFGKIIECYKNGDLALHIHIAEHCCDNGGFQTEFDVSKSCTVVQFFPTETFNNSTVLVEVVEFVQETERVIPSLVRLQSLDECFSCYGNPAEPLSAIHRFAEVLGAATDRKLIPWCRLSSVDADKLPHHMVKAGTKVEKEVSDLRTQHTGRLGKSGPDSPIVRFAVYLANDLALTVGQSLDDRKYSFEVFISPSKL